MKVVAFNGSPRKDGNTSILINHALSKIEEAGIETELINIAGQIKRGCTAFASMTAETKALIDRAGYVVLSNGNFLRRKVGAAVTVARRAGSINVFQAINNFFFINGMIVPGSTYWNLGVGREIGDVNSDEEGIQIMQELGTNMAWLMKKIR